MTPRPLMRTAYVRGNLAALTVLGSSNAQLIRASMRGTTLDMIEASEGKTWLPLDLDVELTEAVGRLCGAQGLATWCQASLRAGIRSPLLGPIVSGAARMFGDDPRATHQMIHLVPRAWTHIYRHAGRLQVEEEGEQFVSLVYLDAPASIFESAWYLEGIGASLGVILEMCGASGFVRVDTVGHRAHLRFEWALPARSLPSGLTP